MKTINIRFLMILLVCALVLGGAVHLLHGYQIRRYGRGFLREAQRAKEQNRPGEAVRHLTFYVSLFPEDADALAELGLLLADLSRYRQAFNRLEQVLRREPDRLEVRRRLVAVAMELGRYSDAREHLEQHLLKVFPNDGELLEQLARCQEAAGQYGLAVASLQRAIQNAPQRLEAYRDLARLLRDRLDRAPDPRKWSEEPRPEALGLDHPDSVMRLLVHNNPGSCHALVLCGEYLRGTAQRWPHHSRQAADGQQRSEGEDANGSDSGDPYQAKKLLLGKGLECAVRALQLAPNNPAALLLATRCAAEQGEYGRARKYGQRGIEAHPGLVDMYIALADVEQRAANSQEAIAWLRRGLQAVPGHPQLLWNLANLVIDQGGIKEAERATEQLRATDQPQALVDYLGARIRCAQGRWLEASRGFEQARPDLIPWPDVVKQLDFWLGKCYQELGKTDQQLTAYRRAVTVDPFWVPARIGVAAALLSIGRIEEAAEEYRRIMRLEDAPAEGWIHLARLLVLRNLGISRPARDWEEANQLLDRAEQALPGSAQIPILRAEVLVAQNRIQEAEKLLLEARQADTDQMELWIALAELAQRQRQWQRAAQLLQETQQYFGDTVQLRLARAQYLVRRLGNKARGGLRELAENTEQFSREDLIQLWRGLAARSLRTGDNEQARRLYQLLSKEQPNKLWFWLLLFDLALRAEDQQGMKDALEEIEQIEGQGPLWHYGRAVYLVLLAKRGDQALLDQARQHLAKARVSRPAWSRIPLLAAHIHDLQGEEELAIQNYLLAIDLGERNPTAVRRAVQLLYEHQRYLEADRIIRRLEEQQTPFSAELGRMAAEVSLRLENFDRALEMARQAATGSDDHRDHTWLGQVLAVLGRRAEADGQTAKSQEMLREAEKEMRYAVELCDEAPEPWVALIQFLARSDRSEDAEELIAEAQRKIPPGKAPLAAAQCYEAIGHLEQAETKYQDALAAASDDAAVIRNVAEFYMRTGRPRRAEPQLRRIVAGQVQADQGDAIWSRRNLALILLARGGYRNLMQALALIEKNLAMPGSSAKDRRTKALVLASHPKRQQRLEAIRIFENLVQREQMPTPQDQFLLAQLYMAEGRWANATRQMRNLLASHGSEPRFVTSYVQALLQHNEVGEAELWLQRLEELAPERFLTKALRAEALFQRRRFGLALKTLKAASSSPGGEQADTGDRVLLVAATLEKFAQRLAEAGEDSVASQFAREAEALYREYAGQESAKKLVFAAFLARQGETDRALALTEQWWDTSDPETVANAISALLAGDTAGREHVRRAETILLAALEKYDRPVPLLRITADLHNFYGRYAEAERLYGELLKKNPGNVVALNNLAVLLALQHRQLGGAQRLIARAIELAGPVATLLDSRAIVHLAAGEPDKALRDLEEAIAEAPKAINYFHQAQAYLALGQRNAAEKALRKAHELGLAPDRLHPLERAAHDRLQTALESPGQ